MAKEKNLKSINRKYLVGYMILNWLVFLLISGRLSLDLGQIKDLYQTSANLFGLLLIPFSVILEGLLNSEFKHRLVFWRFRHPLPACRVFTEIVPHDPRIDMVKLKLLLVDNIPLDSAQQNSVWYGFYKQHSAKGRVVDAHQSFLLTRDLAALSLVLMPLSTAAYLLWRISLKNMAIHLLILTIILLLASIASQNYGKRFVANVLLEAIYSH